MIPLIWVSCNHDSWLFSDAQNDINNKKVLWHIAMILSILSGLSNVIFTRLIHRHGLKQGNLLMLWITTVIINIRLYVLGVPVCAYLSVHQDSMFLVNRRCWSPRETLTFYQLDKAAEKIRSVSFTWPALIYTTFTGMGTLSLWLLAWQFVYGSIH
jgi:hypothetical protein